MIDRREFLKGITAAAAYLSIPAGVLEATVAEAEKLNIPIFYVNPKAYETYLRALRPWERFCNSELLEAGHEHVLIKGQVIMPYDGFIEKKKIGSYEYEELHEILYKFVEGRKKRDKLDAELAKMGVL